MWPGHSRLQLPSALGAAGGLVSVEALLLQALQWVGSHSQDMDSKKWNNDGTASSQTFQFG